MIKSELISALEARHPLLNPQDIVDTVDSILDAMTQSLIRGQRIEIRGFGSFSLSKRKARVGRNPKSGDAVDIPSKQVPHFKAGKAMRMLVNNNTE